MNYLAHLYLSGDSDFFSLNESLWHSENPNLMIPHSEGLVIGNFIADSVKGMQIKNFPVEVQKGIFFHRKIDTYTDMHLTVKQSKARLMPNFRKYSPVIVDVFYDHFLAVKWEKYSSVPFRKYCDSIYKLLESNVDIFPLKSKLFFLYMTENDLLFQYKNISGIEKALTGLSHRASFISNMHLAHNDLVKDYRLYEMEFELFFNDLMKEVHL